MSFTPRVEGIGAVLGSVQLAVPEYQRPYSWTDTEVSDLWDDLSTAIDDGSEEYFLGSVVLTKTEGDRLAVVDGQQRLATVSLLFAAMVDIFESRADERAGEIRREFLGKKGVVTRELTQNLTLNVEDNALFREITLVPHEERNIGPARESHEAIVEAFSFFKKKLVALVEGLGPDEWQRPLTHWYSLLKSKARILQLIADDESRAFVIFETLNDRGVGLNTADLLRNHVFGQSEDRLPEVRNDWAKAFAAISPEGKVDDTETFLKHYWASRNGVVRVKGLYKQMKPSINSPDSAVNFVRDLGDAGPRWAAMYDRDAPYWSDYPPTTLDALYVLRQLAVEQCRPLLLAALRRFEPGDSKRLFQLVMNWSIRWIISGGGGGGTVERLYATSAQNVTDYSFPTVESVVEAFRDEVPSDRAFEAALATSPIRKGWLARYLLRAIERKRSASSEPELVPNENVEEVNLEHVLPKSPDMGWHQYVRADEVDSLVLLLGNQVLLKKSHNRRLGNKLFVEKQPILAASEFSLTKEVAANDTWTSDLIRQRSEQLASEAVEIWGVTL